MLRLGGYVAFDLPRTVTALGGVLLLGIVVTHLYVLTRETALPVYFIVYAVVLIVGCLLAAGAMWLGLNPRVPQLGWLLGDLVSVIFLGLYLASRAANLPGLVALTGRWDIAPGTWALACSAGFIAVHMSVLLGINVAYRQHQNWRD
ncbi:MAG: oxidoreductase [Mycobacterium sp.]